MRRGLPGGEGPARARRLEGVDCHARVGEENFAHFEDLRISSFTSSLAGLDVTDAVRPKPPCPHGLIAYLLRPGGEGIGARTCARGAARAALRPAN